MIFHNYFVFELRISKLRFLGKQREIDLLKFSYLLWILLCYILIVECTKVYAKYARTIFCLQSRGDAKFLSCFVFLSEVEGSVQILFLTDLADFPPILSFRGTRNLRNQNCQSLSSFLRRFLVPRNDKIVAIILIWTLIFWACPLGRASAISFIPLSLYKRLLPSREYGFTSSFYNNDFN